MERRINVRLTTDLTRYLKGLTPGSEGYTIGRNGMWSRGSDQFIGILFPGIGTLDVLWSSLDIIDEEYLKEEAERKAKRFKALKTATNVIEYIGPRGGFKGLSYQYIEDGIPHSTSLGFKKEAEELINFFEEQGIPIKIEKWN